MKFSHMYTRIHPNATLGGLKNRNILSAVDWASLPMIDQ